MSFNNWLDIASNSKNISKRLVATIVVALFGRLWAGFGRQAR
jgi:hypothetical protein